MRKDWIPEDRQRLFNVDDSVLIVGETITHVMIAPEGEPDYISRLTVCVTGHGTIIMRSRTQKEDDRLHDAFRIFEDYLIDRSLQNITNIDIEEVPTPGGNN